MRTSRWIVTMLAIGAMAGAVAWTQTTPPRSSAPANTATQSVTAAEAAVLKAENDRFAAMQKADASALDPDLAHNFEPPSGAGGRGRGYAAADVVK